MDSKKISELPESTDIYDGCCMPIVTNDETKKLTYALLKEKLQTDLIIPDVDDELSDSSENPVQNKVVKAKLDEIDLDVTKATTAATNAASSANLASQAAANAQNSASEAISDVEALQDDVSQLSDSIDEIDKELYSYSDEEKRTTYRDTNTFYFGFTVKRGDIVNLKTDITDLHFSVREDDSGRRELIRGYGVDGWKSTYTGTVLITVKKQDSSSLADLSDNDILVLVSVSNSKIEDMTSKIIVFEKDKKELNNKISDMFNSATTKHYIFDFVEGHEYVCKNTSSSSALACTMYTQNRSESERITGGLLAGKSITFIPSNDYSILDMYLNGEGSFEIYDNNIVVKRVERLEENVSNIEIQIENKKIFSKNASGTDVYDFKFEVGKTYTVVNTSDSSAVVLRLRKEKSGADIQSITEGMEAGLSITFEPIENASYLMTYYNGGGSIEVYENETIKDSLNSHGNEYKPYKNGFIRFSVPVNQNLSNADNTSPQTNDSETFVDVDCVLSLPTTYSKGGEPVPLVMMCHGASHGVSNKEDGNWTTVQAYKNLTNAFKANGYAIFDCSGYDNVGNGFNFWGSPKGVEAWKKAYDYVISNYNVQHNFCIYAFSMGGLTALNLAFHNFPNIKAIALGSPVLNLELCVSESSMRQAYDISGTTYDESKTIGSNPLKHLITVGEKEICNANIPPIKIWYGSLEDGTETAPYVNKEIALRFVNAIVNSGNFAQYRECDGLGHAMSYGGSANITKEFVMWINRFSHK